MSARSSDIDVDLSPPTTGRGGFRFRRVLFALLILILLLLSGAIILHRQLLQAYAPTILNTLVREFRDDYDLELTWDGYRIAGISDFTITGIAVTDLPTGQRLLSCDSLRFRSSLYALAIKGEDPFGAVTSIELDYPVVTLGREDGRWNTGRLLEPREGEKYEFPGRLGLVIRDGIVEWLGGEFADDVPVQRFQIAGIQGNLDLERDGAMGLCLEGMLSGTELEPAPVKMQGVYDPAKELLTITAQVEGMDLRLPGPSLAGYHVEELSGFADAGISLLIGPSAGEDGFSLLGQAAIRDGTIGTDYVKPIVRDVSGDLHFSHKSIFTTGLTANFDDAIINVRGRLADFDDLSFDIVADSDGIPARTIRGLVPDLEMLPVDGRLSGCIAITGIPEDLDILVQADPSDLSLFAVPFRVNHFLAWYAEDKLTIQRCEIGLFGGTVTADGVVDLATDEPAYSASLAVRDIECGPLIQSVQAAIPRDLTPIGNVSADITLSGSGSGFPEVAGVVESNRCMIPKYPELFPLRITVPVEAVENGFRITGASGTAKGLTVLAEGEVSLDGGFAGTVALTIDEPSLLESLTKLPIEGQLALAGDLTVPASGNAAFSGEAEFMNGVIGSLPAPTISARLSYDGSSLNLSDFSGILGGATISGELAIPLSGDAADDAAGAFEMRGLNIGPLLPEKYASVISTSLDITGEAQYARRSETASHDALIFAISISETAARAGPNIFTTVDGGLEVEISLPLGNLSASSIKLRGPIELRPALAEIYQGRVLTPYSSHLVREITGFLSDGTESDAPADKAPIPPISGTFLLASEIVDPLGDTHGSIDVSSEGFALAGWEFESSEFLLSSDDGTHWGVELSAGSPGGGSFDIEGGIKRGATWPESTLDLTATIEDSGINQAFELLGLSELGRFAGSLSGEGRIGGTLAGPVIDAFHLDLSESEAFGMSLKQGGITFGYDPPILTLSELDLEGKDGFHAFGEGSLDLTNPSIANASLVFRLDDFNLELLSDVVDEKPKIGGVLSGSVMLAQDGLGPKVHYSATINDASWKSGDALVQLGNLFLEAVSRPGEKQMELTRVELAGNGESIMVSGLLPSSYLLPQTADLLDLTITSDTGYSPKIPEGLIAAGIAWDGGLGPVDLKLNGSLVRPMLSGEFNVALTDIRLGELTLIHNLDGVFQVEDSVVIATPENVRASGPGWELGLDGQLNLLEIRGAVVPESWRAPRQSETARISVLPITEGPLRISAEQGLSFDVVLGEGEDAPALALREGILALTGKARILGGSIDISNLPEIPIPDEAAGEGLIVLDLQADLEGNLKVSSGTTFEFNFNSGSLALTGYGSSPLLAGTLVAPDGWLDIAGNHFVLIEPLEMTFSSVYRFDPHITAIAQANLREVRSPDSFGEELTVNARINGRLTNIEEVEFTSDPPMSRDEILLALAYEDIAFRTIGGSLFGESFGAPGFQDAEFESLFLPLASSFLSRYIRREAGLLDFEFQLDPKQRLRIYIEGEVLDNLVMYYRRTFGPVTYDTHLWGARYRWRPRSWVGFEVDNDESITPQMQYIIPLD